MLSRFKSKKAGRRAGNTLVQFAFVATIFVMLLFGIIEYCRFIFFRSVVINAAREGARYAVVNLDDTTVVSDTQAKVLTKMFGVQKNLSGYTCNVYYSDAAGNNLGYAGNALFGTYVAVEVYGDYSPIMPVMLKMKKTYTIKARTLMYSEAN